MSYQDYQEFLQTKIIKTVDRGLNTDNIVIPEILKPHQKDVTRWALSNGVGLIAASFGLGKTIVQAASSKVIHEEVGGKTLIVCPLGVRHQFIQVDGPRIGIRYKYVTSDYEVETADTPFLITNYERVRDGNINPKKHNFTMVSLDEGAILRNMGNKTSDIFLDIFKDVKFKFVCTATPAPNNYREIIYYSNYLGVMDSGQSLTRWFGRDVNKAGNLQLLPQYEEEFWLWVSTWALFLYKPSDIGYDDTGYEQPKLNVIWHRLPTNYQRVWSETDNRGQYKMLPNSARSATEAFREKRATLQARLDKALEIVAEMKSNPVDGHNGIIIWHDLEYERQAIKSAIPEAVEIYGSQPLDLREQRIMDFSNGKFDILASKPVLTGSGCNFQHHCHRMIFLGIGYKFADFIQAIHRVQRFLQKYDVEVHIIYSESEDGVANILKQKWEQHNKLTEKMQGIVKEYGLSRKAIEEVLGRTLDIDRKERKETLYTAINNDCVVETQRIESNSVDLIVTSIPFDNHYEYTTNVQDFGYNDNNFREESGFWKQMNFLTPELLRVLKPGRKAIIHVKDRIVYSYQTEHGLTSVVPLSDECVMHFIKHGWVYEGRRTVVTDVVRENNSTYRLGYSEMSKDASKMGSGLPEYLLTFRKPNTDPSKQYADERIIKMKYNSDSRDWECGNCGHKGNLESFEIVERERIYTKHQCPECGQNIIFYSRAKWQLDAHSFWQSDGNVLIASQPYDYESHSGSMEAMDMNGNLSASFLQEPPVSKNDMVWDDIVFMQCLNSEQARRRVTNHVCPLPLDIVRRSIILYSNFGDVVLDPFAGLFTVPYLAIQLGRIGYGIELNKDYFADGVRYCEMAEAKKLAPTLFDLLEEQENN